MIVKPLSLLLIFILTIINFVILLLPFVAIMSPFLYISQDMIREYWLNILLFIAFCTSSLMLLYLLFDIMFGLTVRRLSKGAVPYHKMTALAGFDGIEAAFLETKFRFGQPKVELYIDQRFDVVNAFAVGSFLRKRIIITIGLLQSIHSQCSDELQYVDAIKGILGHEMSHLANKDFLPGLLVAANDAANRHLSSVLRLFFMILVNILKIIPYVGGTLGALLVVLYNAVNALINFFLSWIILPIYRFIQKGLGRSIEYRCDRESAYAFSGVRMAIALSMLGKGSYFSMFSTHPRTRSRIKKVRNIMPRGGIIKPNIIARLANFVSVVGLVAMCAFCGYASDMPKLGKQYMKQVHGPLQQKIQILIRDGKALVEKVKGY